MKSFNRLAARGVIKEGKLLFNKVSWVRGMISQYADCEVVVTIEKKRKNRSKEQMGYLWGVVYPTISEVTGHSPEELHAIYKTKFLKRKVNWRGSSMVVLSSTSRLTTNEMGEFITNIIVDAAEMDIEIPEPDPEMVAKKQTS